MIGGSKFRTQKARVRERKFASLRVALVVVGVCLLFAGMSYAVTHPALRIQEVVAQSDGSIGNDKLHDEVTRWLTGTTLKVLPHDSVFFFSKDRLARHLRTLIPRIDTVAITRPTFRTLHIAVTERTPTALWCGDIVPPVAQTHTASSTGGWGNCHLLDDDSYVYARAPQYSGTPFPRYYSSLSQAEPVAQYMLHIDEFHMWQAFQEELIEQGTPLHAFLFVDERDVELYFVSGLRVLASRTEATDTLAANVYAMLESGTIDMSRPITYLDMRFGNKVFIKYADEQDDEQDVE